MVDGLGTGHLQGVERIRHGLQVPPREVQINCRIPELHVAEQQLDGAQIGSRFQQMGRVGMSPMSFKT